MIKSPDNNQYTAMDWHDHFQQVFFETWHKAGMPDPRDFLPAYYKMIEERDVKTDWLNESIFISPGINHTRLYNVYGFGMMVGKVLAGLLGLPSEQTPITADWCGRFNLGISLVDYIADEMGGVKNIDSLKVFERFTNANNSGTRSLSAAEEFLSQLAGGVLNDLKNSGKKEERKKNDLLFHVLQEMFDAQKFVSTEKLSAGANLKKIENALYLKSAEPFRLMAEYTARFGDSNNSVLVKNAISIGKALGYCYWVIDDAKDVWIDLEARQWNLFLQLAAAEDASLFAEDINKITDSDLMNIWKNENHAEKIAGQTIKRLVDAIGMLELYGEVKQHSLGVVGASLWHWYHC